jgi:hypothetical protein
MTLRYSGAGALEGPYAPEMGNIDIRDCTFANLTKQPIFIEGYDEKIKITGVTVANCTFQNVRAIGTPSPTPAAFTCSTIIGASQYRNKRTASDDSRQFWRLPK